MPEPDGGREEFDMAGGHVNAAVCPGDALEPESAVSFTNIRCVMQTFFSPQRAEQPGKPEWERDEQNRQRADRGGRPQNDFALLWLHRGVFPAEKENYCSDVRQLTLGGHLLAEGGRIVMRDA